MSAWLAMMGLTIVLVLLLLVLILHLENRE